MVGEMVGIGGPQKGEKHSVSDNPRLMIDHHTRHYSQGYFKKGTKLLKG